MRWVLWPSSLIVRHDGTLWTAGHQGYFTLRAEWCFWRVHKARIGYFVDKGEVWRFDVWPPGLKVAWQ